MHFAIATLVATCLSANLLVEAEVASPEFLKKQIAVYDLFWHVDQPEKFTKVYDAGKSYDLTKNLGSYKHEEYVTEFLKLYEHGMLPRGEIFSMMHPTHLREAIALFKVFFYAKDFETLYKTAAWARIHVNAGLFVYAFSVAVIHHPETQKIRVPAHSELYPYLYFSNEVIREAYNAKGYTDPTKSSSVDDAIVIYDNFTNYKFFDDEYKLKYYTEDVGVNDIQYFIHLTRPFWMSTEEYGLTSKIRGELFFFSSRLQMTRYYMERLSNDLGEIEDFDWSFPMPYSFYSGMSYHNGKLLPHRVEDAVVPSYNYKFLKQLRDYEQRISMAIDLEKVIDKTGEFRPINSTEGVQILGNLIEGNADSINHDFYGGYNWLARNVLGFSPPPIGKYKVLPSVMQRFGLDQRDPMFWSLVKRFLRFYDQYSAKLPKYTREELAFPGVKIESVQVGPITTFFEYYDYLISGAVKVYSNDDQVLIKARRHRLTHKPYTYTINVQSEKKVKANMRIFLGPKYDVHGEEIDITENYKNFLLLDGWDVELEKGTNKIERKSTDAFDIRAEEDGSGDLFYKKIFKASKGEGTYEIPKMPYTYPYRMSIPKGKKEGMPFQFFVFVTPVEGKPYRENRTPLSGVKVYLDVPLGFPLERPVTSEITEFPNGFFQEVLVFHKEESEINRTT